jgi:FAD/FMN-containing dehydrogenase
MGDTVPASQLDTGTVEAFAASLRGSVTVPTDPGYDEARKVYNAMIDKRPGIIAHCADVADVIAAVDFARDNRLDLAVRGGGHNGGGLGTVDGGIVIDLSAIRGVRVDPEAKLAYVAGGSLLGDVDHATHAFGLATPAGIISTTGAGGLTLGGGVGHTTRGLGLTIDNLVAADVVTADGRFLTASQEKNEDLFWALRGGGGNFGVVTSFTYRLHPLSTVVAGPTLWPLERAADVMAWYRDFIRSAPEELGGFFAYLVVPPGPPFPEHLHMKKMCGVVWTYTGPAEKAEEVFRPVRAVPGIALDGLMTLPYPAWQSAFDGLYPPGHQWYWKADFLKEIPDEAIARHVEHGSQMPTMQSGIHIYPIDGAAHRARPEDTAWSYRDANWAMVIIGVDPDPANAGLIKSWASDYWEAVHPYSAGGGYLNFMMDEGQERVRASYRDNYDLLAVIKAKYDPGNLFHVNQNIVPARQAAHSDTGRQHAA